MWFLITFVYKVIQLMFQLGRFLCLGFMTYQKNPKLFLQTKIIWTSFLKRDTTTDKSAVVSLLCFSYLLSSSLNLGSLFFQNFLNQWRLLPGNTFKIWESGPLPDHLNLHV